MSCFLVNNKTVSAIVTALIELEYIHESEAQSFLNSMMQLNYLSVNNRYLENNEMKEFIFKKQNIIFNDASVEDENKIYHSVMQMILNIQFYKYQSCEVEFFDKTLVCKTLEKLNSELLNQFKSWLVMSGYESWESVRNKPYHKLRFSDECAWGLDD
ncbi:TPA: hypothetical protein ACKRC9_003711 [Proteus mirabilis]|nr:hypothetical protein [Proteus mirabilis]ELB2631288.1 hypothetical protein [Proteus mirabilis]MDN3789846.1 hypothetical protein [Proteus mirabilis]HEM8286415.1 hypothetical protein [Providencia stuartii]